MSVFNSNKVTKDELKNELEDELDDEAKDESKDKPKDDLKMIYLNIMIFHQHHKY